MDERPATEGRTPRAGGYALAFGLLAAAYSPVPVIGDLVSVPMVIVAIVCGVICLGHYDGPTLSLWTSRFP